MLNVAHNAMEGVVNNDDIPLFNPAAFTLPPSCHPLPLRCVLLSGVRSLPYSCAASLFRFGCPTFIKVVTEAFFRALLYLH